MKSGIYQIRNILNGRVYVGSAVNIQNRWRDHKKTLKRGIHDNAHLQNAWNKYGADVFVFEILERVKSKKLVEWEQYWMDELDVVKSGYNINPVAGSSLGVKRSAETRAKISEIAKKRKFSPEHRAKIGAASRAYWSSSEARAKQSASHMGKPSPNKGKKASPETRAKLRAARKKQWTPEARAKLSEKTKGRPGTRKGHKVSLETRAKLSASGKAYWNKVKENAKMELRNGV